MKINLFQAIPMRDTTQWIRVRGNDASNPVLLLIQLGPGVPMINEARRFGQVFNFEQFYTVVYWDQRGCGLSLRGQKAGTEISLERMVDDTVSMLEFLRNRFGGKITIAGFSLGATLGAYAAALRPELVEALVTVGMDIDGAAASRNAYEFALRTARERGNRRAIRQLEAVGPPPHLNGKQFMTRVRWASNFGGVATNGNIGTLMRELMMSLLRSSDYSLADMIRTLRGISETQAALLSDVEKLNLVRTLPRIDVPVIMVQGRLDQVAPGADAQRYADALHAPSKQLIWFENSAHSPHLEEPDKFRDILMRVRAGECDGQKAQNASGRYA